MLPTASETGIRPPTVYRTNCGLTVNPPQSLGMVADPPQSLRPPSRLSDEQKTAAVTGTGQLPDSPGPDVAAGMP